MGFRFWAAKWMIAMRNELTMRLRLGLIAGACGALLALGSVAHAQQAADDDEDTFEQRIIKSILGGLGANVGGAGIEYRERSPLVIPPSLDLPPPDSAAARAQNPAWPREPDRKKVVIHNKINRYANRDDPGTSSRLSPDELRRGINPRAERVTDRTKTGAQEDIDIGRPMRPKELGVTGTGIFSWGALTGQVLSSNRGKPRPPGKPASVSRRRASSGFSLSLAAGTYWPSPGGTKVKAGCWPPLTTLSVRSFRSRARLRARRTRTSLSGALVVLSARYRVSCNGTVCRTEGSALR